MIVLEYTSSRDGHVEPAAYMGARTDRFMRQGPTVFRYHHQITEVYAHLGVRPQGLSVDMPVMRPTCWGDELEAMLTPLARAAGLHLASDAPAPTPRGTWDRANLQAWRLADRSHRVVISRACTHTWWTWNHALPLHEPLYPGLFVPTVRLVEHDGRWCSAVVWTDGVPALIPRVDLVLVLAAALAAKGLTPGLLALSRDALERHAGAIPPGGLAVSHAATDPGWLGLFAQLPRVAGKPRTIHPEDAVQREVLPS